MSFKAEFTLGSKKFRVLESQLILNQEVDSTGRPASTVRGGRATLTIEGSSEQTKPLFAWAADPIKAEKSCTLTYYKRDGDAKDREVEFKNAYCIYLDESYRSDTPQPYLVKFIISAEEVTDKHAELKNDWPKQG